MRGLKDCGERLWIGHESSPCSGERPLRCDLGVGAVHDLDFQFRLLSKQRDDFVEVIHRYLRALGLGRFNCERFLGRIRVTVLMTADGRVERRFLVFEVRVRATARLTSSASCPR